MTPDNMPELQRNLAIRNFISGDKCNMTFQRKPCRLFLLDIASYNSELHSWQLISMLDEE
jgi:hypothetical protein